jgi:membrane protease subunit HflC
MRSERQQVAGRIRAEGERDAAIIRATAQEEAQRLMGEGDAERSRIFARAYGRDPEFAAFYRSMRAYDEALDAGTPIVVPPDSDFFRYMQSRRGGR